jgi:hypothetical protein
MGRGGSRVAMHNFKAMTLHTIVEWTMSLGFVSQQRTNVIGSSTVDSLSMLSVGSYFKDRQLITEVRDKGFRYRFNRGR